MTYTDINKIPLPSLGSGDIISPDLYNDGIKLLDEVKIQYVPLELKNEIDGPKLYYVKTGTEVTEYSTLEGYCKSHSYYVAITNYKGEFFNIPVISIKPFNALTLTPGEIIFGYMNDKYLRTIAVKSLDGSTINITENEIAIVLNKDKVQNIDSSVTDEQYPSAKATYDFVTSSINSNAAYYITKNKEGEPFNTYAELISTTEYYSGGYPRTPTKNDYCIILDDENHDNYSCRYMWQDRWVWQYKYEKQLTAKQMDAINSGITEEKVKYYDSIIETGSISGGMLYNSTGNKITQGNEDITHKIVNMLKPESGRKILQLVLGEDYGDMTDTDANIEFIWVGRDDPGVEIKNKHRKTLFIVNQNLKNHPDDFMEGE